MTQQFNEKFSISETEDRFMTEEQTKTTKSFSVGNAGLCLLSPWFLRLFSILGYLSEDKKKFKDTDSEIRAVFLLQYLTCLEEKEYQEEELTFGRLVVALPMNILLPRQLGLTDDEKQTAQNMLQSVKANWVKIASTSIKAFQQSFLARAGRLEEQEEKWILTVDSRAYDILLDSIPWSFHQVRLPWLKKSVEVAWREKSHF